MIQLCTLGQSPVDRAKDVHNRLTPIVLHPVYPSALNLDEFNAQSIRLQKRQIEAQEATDKWSRIASLTTAIISTLAIVAALGAWVRTGKVQAPSA
jgi:hypothetical protein